MKKLYLLILLILFCSLLFSQQKQITKFAVVDVQKIYNTFKQNSGLVRDYEEKKTRYQEEIQVLSDEIIELKKKKTSSVTKKGRYRSCGSYF